MSSDMIDLVRRWTWGTFCAANKLKSTLQATIVEKFWGRLRFTTVVIYVVLWFRGVRELNSTEPDSDLHRACAASEDLRSEYLTSRIYSEESGSELMNCVPHF